MILVKPSFEILSIMGLKDSNDYGSLELIELAGRTCYKSDKTDSKYDTEGFVSNILGKGHESVIEHSAMTVKFICDRGVTHELVRHRLCAFSQESTRYVNYKGGCTFVIPPWIDIKPGNYLEMMTSINQEFGDGKSCWFNTMLLTEENYKTLITIDNWTPQQARSVLPNSTKTEIVMTANFREWRHIFSLRCANAAHPQMREIMRPLLDRCKELIPVIFDDITY